MPKWVATITKMIKARFSSGDVNVDMYRLGSKRWLLVVPVFNIYNIADAIDSQSFFSVSEVRLSTHAREATMRLTSTLSMSETAARINDVLSSVYDRQFEMTPVR